MARALLRRTQILILDEVSSFPKPLAVKSERRVSGKLNFGDKLKWPPASSWDNRKLSFLKCLLYCLVEGQGVWPACLAASKEPTVCRSGRSHVLIDNIDTLLTMRCNPNNGIILQATSSIDNDTDKLIQVNFRPGVVYVSSPKNPFDVQLQKIWGVFCFCDQKFQDLCKMMLVSLGSFNCYVTQKILFAGNCEDSLCKMYSADSCTPPPHNCRLWSDPGIGCWLRQGVWFSCPSAEGVKYGLLWLSCKWDFFFKTLLLDGREEQGFLHASQASVFKLDDKRTVVASCYETFAAFKQDQKPRTKIAYMCLRWQLTSDICRECATHHGFFSFCRTPRVPSMA